MKEPVEYNIPIAQQKGDETVINRNGVWTLPLNFRGESLSFRATSTVKHQSKIELNTFTTGKVIVATEGKVSRH